MNEFKIQYSFNHGLSELIQILKPLGIKGSVLIYLVKDHKKSFSLDIYLTQNLVFRYTNPHRYIYASKGNFASYFIDQNLKEELVYSLHPLIVDVMSEIDLANKVDEYLYRYAKLDLAKEDYTVLTLKEYSVEKNKLDL